MGLLLSAPGLCFVPHLILWWRQGLWGQERKVTLWAAFCLPFVHLTLHPVQPYLYPNGASEQLSS